MIWLCAKMYNSSNFSNSKHAFAKCGYFEEFHSRCFDAFSDKLKCQ